MNKPLYILVIASLLFSGYLFVKVQSLEKKAASGDSVAQIKGEQAKNQAPQQPVQNLKEIPSIPPVSDKDHILGNKNADVVLIEYSDFECPFCKRFHATMQQVVKEYGNKVAWVYRQYPLGFHANAQKEAEATECAAEQGGNEAFWKYTDQIIERTTSNGTGFALDKLVPLASELGLNGNKFKQCLDSGKYAQHVKDDMEGGSKAGIEGTPGTVVIGKNGKKEFITGALPYDQIKPLIDKVLSGL